MIRTADMNSPFAWNIGKRRLQRTRIPLLMGIVNVTPDSFSDGGHYNTPEAAVAHAMALVSDGADIIDIGGESTRPGADSVSANEEMDRTAPVIERLVQLTDTPISIDTTKAAVAEQAVQSGASIINDVSGLTFDPDMRKLCASTDVGICLMHIKGNPQNMQDDPTYEDVVLEVSEFLNRQIQLSREAGIATDRLCIDPGIGFGKTAEHNLQLLSSVNRLQQSADRPVLIGHSRKRFLSKILGRNVEERLSGTIGVAVAVAQQGADILRIHDVCAVRDALVAWDAVSRMHGFAGETRHLFK